MGWEKGRYYTRSRKVNGRVVREYIGGGEVGAIVAQMDAMERERRESERECWRLEKGEMESFDASVAKVCEMADIIAEAAIVAAGFHRHRGEWRRRRVQKKNELKAPDTPEAMLAIIERTQSGDEKAMPALREMLDCVPETDDTLYLLLAERGLVEPRVKAGTLATFVDGYITGRSDVTERRLSKFENAKAQLLDFFGDVKLETVTPGAADDYSRWLLTQLAPTTAHKECQIAAQFFRHAFRKELIERNPFDGVVVGQATNDDRRVFVSRDVIQRVLDECPNWQWRTVVALARYGGLRCSSEVALLKWCDMNWDAERFTVPSPKTKRYGKATRVVPMFPELRPFLDEAFSMAAEGEKWVVPMLGGDADKNLGTT